MKRTYETILNLTSDWDAENRLTGMLALRVDDDLGNAILPLNAVFIKYDFMGRRTRVDWSYYDPIVGTNWNISKTFLFLYDGWNPVAGIEMTPGEADEVQCYTWGPDISGQQYRGNLSMGAGGVGGLLELDVFGWLPVAEGTATQTRVSHFVSYDGNGNVMALTNAHTQTQSAA